MLNTILIGILIGLFTSVPVGPLGILIIQRTLSRGRWHGVATGLGASTSDLLYAAAVGFGMSYITNFINEYLFWIQIVGSIIIVLFGVHVFFSNPAKQLESAKDSPKTDYLGEFASGFGLCFSNPLIIFIFIGLFAQFNFFEPGQSYFEDVIGLCSILAGALSWWLTLTFLVSKLRNRFNVRGLWILNKITGGLLVLAGLIVCLKALI